jgi:hypothetical protein
VADIPLDEVDLGPDGNHDGTRVNARIASAVLELLDMTQPEIP